MPRLPLRNHLLGLLIGLAVAITLLIISESGFRRSSEALLEIRAAQQTLAANGRIYRTLNNAELAQRSYLLTGEAQYLQRYREQIASVREQLTALQQAPTPGTAPLVIRLGQAIARKQSEMDLSIRLRQSGEADASYFVATADDTAELGESSREVLDAIIDSGRERFDASVQAVATPQQHARVGLALATLIGLAAYLLYLRRGRELDRAQRDANNKLAAERDALDELVRERTATLAELASHLQQAREDERGMLARELHDELGALLTAAKLDVARIKSRLPADAREARERLAHLTDALNSGIALKRRIIENLRPSSLSNLGLKASLEILAREFAERSGLVVDTLVEPVELDENRQLVVYRTVQESLTNVAKYAQAQRVIVRVCGYRNHVEVTINDDGRGFNPSQMRSGSHGLTGMRHRVESVGGRLTVSSQPQLGTRIEASIPSTAPPPPAPAGDESRPAPLSSMPAPASVPPPADAGAAT